MQKNVMIVDDDVTTLDFVQTIFHERGINALALRDGEQCLDAVGKGFEGVAVVDLMMPKLNGYEVIRELVKKSLTEKVKVVIFTAKQEPDPAYDEFRSLGVPYFKKPFEPEKLIECVQDILAQGAPDPLTPGALRETVLVAEDSLTLRNSVAKILRMEGYRVYTASDGSEALATFKKNKVEMVVTDVIMPKKSGLELAEDVKRIDPKCNVIMMTATPNDGDFMKAYTSLRIDRYVTKPFDLNRLAGLIESCFQTKRLIRNVKNAQIKAEFFAKEMKRVNEIAKSAVN